MAALIAVHVIAAIGLLALARVQTDPFRTAHFWLLLLLVTQASLLAVWAAAGGASAAVRTIGFVIGLAVLDGVWLLAGDWLIPFVPWSAAGRIWQAMPSVVGLAVWLLLMLAGRRLRFVRSESETSNTKGLWFPLDWRRLMVLALGAECVMLLLSPQPWRTYELSVGLVWAVAYAVVPLAAFAAFAGRGNWLLRLLWIPLAVLAFLALKFLLGPRNCLLYAFPSLDGAPLYVLLQTGVVLASLAIVRRCGYRLMGVGLQGDALAGRIAIRDALFVVLLVGIACGLFKLKLDRAESQRRAVAAIVQQGGRVRYQGSWARDSLAGASKRWIPEGFLDVVEIVTFDGPGGQVELSALDGLPHVVWVALRNSALRDAEAELPRLESHPSLVALDLGATRVSSDDLARLSAGGRLRDLAIDGECISRAGIRALNANPQLEILRVRGAKLDDERAALLAELTNVKRLEFTGSSVTDQGLAPLARMRQLEDVFNNGRHFTRNNLDR